MRLYGMGEGKEALMGHKWGLSIPFAPQNNVLVYSMINHGREMALIQMDAHVPTDHGLSSQMQSSYIGVPYPVVKLVRRKGSFLFPHH